MKSKRPKLVPRQAGECAFPAYHLVSFTPWLWPSPKPDTNGQLWTDRYAPQSLKEVCGNKGQIEKLQAWLSAFDASLQSDFKKPGKDGMNVFRAVMITGPPGIGKTTSAHLCAKLTGYTPIELNASDARSKKLVEVSWLVDMSDDVTRLMAGSEQHEHHEHLVRRMDGGWEGELSSHVTRVNVHVAKTS